MGPASAEPLINRSLLQATKLLLRVSKYSLPGPRRGLQSKLKVDGSRDQEQGATYGICNLALGTERRTMEMSSYWN